MTNTSSGVFQPEALSAGKRFSDPKKEPQQRSVYSTPSMDSDKPLRPIPIVLLRKQHLFLLSLHVATQEVIITWKLCDVYQGTFVFERERDLFLNKHFLLGFLMLYQNLFTMTWILYIL